MLLVHVVPVANAKFAVGLIVRPVSFSEVNPELVNVTFFAALVVPVFWLPKLKLVDDSETCGSVTIAVISAECGLPAALSVMMSVAVEAVGLKISRWGRMPTPITQLFPAGNVPGMDRMSGGQKLMSPYSLRALPGAPVLMLEIVIGVVPLLVIVTN